MAVDVVVAVVAVVVHRAGGAVALRVPTVPVDAVAQITPVAAVVPTSRVAAQFALAVAPIMVALRRTRCEEPLAAAAAVEVRRSTAATNRSPLILNIVLVHRCARIAAKWSLHV